MKHIRHVLSAEKKRVLRIRQHMEGSAEKPRISISRSNRAMSVQAIDDVAGVTIAGTIDDLKAKGTKTERATATGARLAALLLEKKITTAIFDRGEYRYHGRVRAVAEALREAGIKV